MDRENKRMIGEYEVIHALHIGDREIIVSLAVFKVDNHFVEVRHAYDIVAACWCDRVEAHCAHNIPS